MAEALMEVGVDCIGKAPPLADEFLLFVGICKLVEKVLRRLLGGLVLGLGNVRDSDGLGTVFLADPVRVGKIDTDWS